MAGKNGRVLAVFGLLDRDGATQEPRRAERRRSTCAIASLADRCALYGATRWYVPLVVTIILVRHCGH